MNNIIFKLNSDDVYSHKDEYQIVDFSKRNDYCMSSNQSVLVVREYFCV